MGNSLTTDYYAAQSYIETIAVGTFAGSADTLPCSLSRLTECLLRELAKYGDRVIPANAFWEIRNVVEAASPDTQRNTDPLKLGGHEPTN